MSVEIPHFALPFRIVDGAAAVTEQDSREEIEDCVAAIMLCPQGHRVELPGFGRPDDTFGDGASSEHEVLAAVDEWEPRARALAEAELAPLASLVSKVTVKIQSSGGA